MTRSPTGSERPCVDTSDLPAPAAAGLASVCFCQATAEGEPALPMAVAVMQPQGLQPYRTISW
ncbi:MAG: hypothetical protein RLZZ459_2413 [Cyanobacteriota bacterium]|jgi:hypothetical protein